MLVVRLDSIGDVLLSEPAIAALRRRYPSAQLDVVCSAAGRDILANSPHIDRFIIYEAPWHAAWRGARVNWLHELPKLWRVIKDLRSRRHDLAVELRGDARDIILTSLGGPRFIAGSPIRGAAGLLDRAGPVEEDLHRVEFNLAIAAAAGAPAPPTRPRIYLTPAARLQAKQWLGDEAADYIAVHLGSGFVSKQVPVPTYVEALRQIAPPERGRRLVLIGGPDEAPLAQQFASLMPYPYLDLVGQASLAETAAVLERCRLFVGNDSAPMHMAASLGTPVVACFGPSPIDSYGPYGVPHRIVSLHFPCSPCDQVHCIFQDDLPLRTTMPDVGTVAAANLCSMTSLMLASESMPAVSL
jgi:ADP-heptose:LPS heptosyltransferase